MKAVLLGSLFLVACSSSGTSGAASGSATSRAPAPAPSASVATSTAGAPGSAAPIGPAAVVLPKVTVDGAELLVKDAIVYNAGGKAMMVVVSTEPLDCTAERLMVGKKGEKRVDFTLGQTFTNGGSGLGKWVTRFTSYGDDGAGHLRLPPDKGQSIEVRRAGPDGLDATVDLSAGEAIARAGKSYSVKGPIVARGCGVVSAFQSGKDRPQSKLNASILGNSVEIHAARVEPYNLERQIVLSTQQAPCEYKPFPTQDVEIRLTLEGTPPRIGSIWVEGDRFSPDHQSLNVMVDEQTITLGPSKDGVVPIEIKTKAGEVALSGHIDALDCPK